MNMQAFAQCGRLSGGTVARVVLTLTLAIAASGAWAQDLGDRSEVERKKKEREELEKQRAAMEVKESEEQREARERQEAKDKRIKLAQDKAQQSAQAAAKRQNDRGLELMESAWYLDPVTLDYPRYTAEFAKALNKQELEFRAWAAVKVLCNINLAQLGPDAPRRSYYEEALGLANARLEVLRTKLATGILKVAVEPASCEIIVENAYVGTGKGEIETITGGRKVETRCQGYYDYEQFVSVRQGDPTEAKVKPNPIPYFGKLVVKLEPSDGVTIYLDDVPLEQRTGPKPTKEGTVTGKGTKEEPIQLAARRWILRFQKEGYDRWHRRIEVRRDQTVLIDAKLESLAELAPDKDANKGEAPKPEPVKPKK